jgi:hypothetical protein
MALATVALAVSASIILISNAIPPEEAFQDEKE